MTDWHRHAPGARVACPACHRRLAAFGRALEVSVRVHPHGNNADPTTDTGLSIRCQRCATQLDLRWVEVHYKEAS